MKFYAANIADVLRLSQRDDVFLRDVENKIHGFFKVMGPRSYYKMNKTVPAIANVWYYFMTTLGNLQTLGEEYTGTIRVEHNSKIPSKILQTLWLVLYVGGEPLLDRLLDSSKNKITRSSSLTSEAKRFLVHCVEFLKEAKPDLRRIHNSLFYMNGKYYNISNRITGIRYVLLRQWLQDNSFTGGFRLLGNISLFYVLFNFFKNFVSWNTSGDYSENVISTNISRNGCVICGENIKSASATPCGHIFCWNCINQSLNYQKTCPLCIEVVKPNRVIFLQNYV